jgi:hypothetical protein
MAGTYTLIWGQQYKAATFGLLDYTLTVTIMRSMASKDIIFEHHIVY